MAESASPGFSRACLLSGYHDRWVLGMMTDEGFYDLNCFLFPMQERGSVLDYVL